MRILQIFTVIAAVAVVWSSCVYNDIRPQVSDLNISIRWTKAYASESKENIMTGLAWGLSFLGASLPPGSLNNAVYWTADDHFILDIKAAGFPEASWPVWTELIADLQQSDEYIRQGGIDLGRFIMLTLNSTNHYHAITGARARLSEFRANYNFDTKKAAILKSSVASGNRVIEIGIAHRFQDIAFIATEGEGSVPEHNFTETEFEVMDLMPNGQLRFALYDLNGNLKTSASPLLTIAGKPAKCLWCHEISLLPPFMDYPAVDDYYTKEEYTALVDNRIQFIQRYRATLASDIDFSKTQAHTQTELLYLSFMEPSAERLALEWGLPITEVKASLQGLPVHVNAEFAFLGKELYSRKDIDDLAPYKSVRVPEDPRNASAYEPDIVHP